MISKTQARHRVFRRFRIVGIILCMLSLATNARSAQDLPSLLEHILPGVVVIVTRSQKGNGLGSGFFVTYNGDILTNWHVVEGADIVTVTTDDQRQYPARIKAWDTDADMALITIQSTQYRPLRLAGTIPRLGSSVVAVGAPNGFEKSISDGLVSQVHRVQNGSYLQVSCPISPGSSGGPILSLNGEVVGMATLTLKEGQNLNFAVPAPTLNQFVNRSRSLVPRTFNSIAKASGAVARPASAPVVMGVLDGVQQYLDVTSIHRTEGSIVEFTIHGAASANLLKNYPQWGNAIVYQVFQIDNTSRQIRHFSAEIRDKNDALLGKSSQTGPWQKLEEAPFFSGYARYILSQAGM